MYGTLSYECLHHMSPVIYFIAA